MKRQTFTTLTFFLMLAFGFLLGRSMVEMSLMGSSVLGLVLSFIGMFVGMILTHMHLYSKIQKASVRQNYVEEKRIEFEERMRDLAARQGALQDEALLEFAKGVSQKVANKILAKHFDGLAEDSKRAELFKGVDAIVEDEVRQAGIELADQHDV